MASITWRNIDAPDLRAVAQIQNQGAQMIQTGLSDIGNVFKTMGENQLAQRDREQNQALGEFNLELSQMSPEQIQEFMQSSEYDADALKSRFGGNIDLNKVVGDVRTARDSSIDNVMKMTQYENMQDAQADKSILPDYFSKLASGDVAGAQELTTQFKSPEIAQNAFNSYRKTMESDRSFGLDQQRLGLDAARTKSSIALNNANLEGINLRNQMAKQELATKSAMSEIGAFLRSDGNSTDTADSGSKVDLVGMTDTKKGTDKPKSFAGMLGSVLGKLSGNEAEEPASQPKVQTPAMSTNQAFQIAALTGDRQALRGVMESYNAQRIREKKAPIPITDDTISQLMATGQQSATPTAQQLGRIDANVNSYNSKLTETVTSSKNAAFNKITEGNPVLALAASNQAFGDITTDVQAIAKVRENYKSALGEDADKIDDASLRRYQGNLKKIAEDAGVQLTPAMQYYIMTALPPPTDITYMSDKRMANYGYAKNLVQEFVNEVNTNGNKRFSTINDNISEAYRVIDETAASQSANASALIQTNIVRGKGYSTNLPTASKLDNANSAVVGINKWVSDGEQYKTGINKWKESQKMPEKPKPAFTGNAQKFEPRKQDERV